METVAFTTTLDEMNRLYGVYCEMTNGEKPNPEQSAKAWSDYETYAQRFKTERGLN
jgi:hypothetical protein